MKHPTKVELFALRERFKPGTKIVLEHMADEKYPVPPKTIGTVKYVDDMGNVQVTWQNGSSLALIPEADTFTLLPGGSE